MVQSINELKESYKFTRWHIFYYTRLCDYLLCENYWWYVYLGEAMREKEIVIGHVYSSPSLRCVETASSLLEGEQIGLGGM